MTPPKPPEEINVAIAQLCGWKIERFKVLSTTYVGIHSPDGIRRGDVYDNPKDIALQWKQIAPNYHGSLDAMHEAEKTLTDVEYAKYEIILQDSVADSLPMQPLSIQGIPLHPVIMAPCGYIRYASATAPQRCAAFLSVKSQPK